VSLLHCRFSPDEADGRGVIDSGFADEVHLIFD